MKKPTTKEILVAVTPLIALVAGYFGHDPIQELTAPPSPSVDVEVIVPDQAQHNHAHSHKQKDWHPIIKSEIEKATGKLRDEYH